MKKRAMCLLLALVMVFGLLPVTARAATLDNGLKYKVDGNHVVITGYSGDAQILTIPDTIEGLPVTEIGKNAFQFCGDLIRVSIPDSVTTIGEHAFSVCGSLLSIDIPDGVTAINTGTFMQCNKLTSIELPDSLTSIGDSAFYGCNHLKNIDIPDSVTSIGEFAFIYCDDLTSIDIPDGVTSIGTQAFSQCSGLTSIDIPDGVTAIEDATFNLCENLTSIKLPKGLTSIGKSAFYGCESLLSIDIPDGVTSIGDQAFWGCRALRSVHLPDKILSVNERLFLGCTSLTSITIPSDVEMIDTLAFDGCKNLTSIYFTGDAPWIEDSTIYVAFNGVTATAYYPAGNITWTEDVMKDYGGKITWVPYNPSNPFTDVPLGAYYEEPVIWAVENGITDGVTETSFAPDNQCLRSQVVTFLHRAAKNPEPTSTNNPFTDVKPGDYFYNPVLWAVEKGITDGVSETAFGSNNVCTRGQVVTLLWRAAGKPDPTSTTNPFTDVNSDNYFYNPVLWALEEGITDGVTETSFAPNATCTRAQVVTFLHRANN